MQVEEITIKTEGTDLGARVYQGGKKRLIVYLSPICLHSGWFKEVLEKLAIQFEATIVAIDVPGIGLSPGGIVVVGRKGVIGKLFSCCDFDLTVLAEKIKRALPDLKKEYQTEKTYLLGSSLGGIISSYVLAVDQGNVLDGVIFQAGFASSGAEINQYVKPRIRKIPEQAYYSQIKKALTGLPAFAFVYWSVPGIDSVIKQTKETAQFVDRFLKDPETVISFTIRTLESLFYAPEILLPEAVPILFLKSERDGMPVNQQIEMFLARHHCDKTIVLLKGAPHLVFDSEMHTKVAVAEIEKWFCKVEQAG